MSFLADALTEVVHGDRKRKQTVSVYQVSQAGPTEVSIPEGKGTPLGDMENVKKRLSGLKSDDDSLRLLYRCAFARIPRKASCKADLRQFSGLASEQASTKAVEKLNKATVNTIKQVAALVGLQHTGTKGELVERVQSFLEKPVENDGDSEYKSMSDLLGKRKRAASTAKGNKKKTKKSAAKKKKNVPGPKRANAYMAFVKEQRPLIVKKHPELSFGEVGKMLGSVWRELTDEGKAEYKAAAERALAEEEGQPKKKAKKSTAAAAAMETESEEESEDDRSEALAQLSEMELRVKAIVAAGDLTTLSKKKVRAQLKEEFGDDVVASVKAELNECINAAVQARLAE